MIIEITKKYLHTPFAVRTEEVKNEPGTWSSTKVSIFRGETLIGEYIRNYSNYGSNTFHPFKLNNEWYALYSANYTATRIMKLHIDHIEDWCGEDDSATGFCPVEFYVPQYLHSKYNYEDSESDYYLADCDLTEEEFNTELEDPKFVSVDHCDFGFLCGCVWGDDSSWKLRHIDLTQIPDKKLIITDKFGYWQLPNRLTLRECISMHSWEPDNQWISLIKSEHFNLNTDEFR